MLADRHKKHEKPTKKHLQSTETFTNTGVTIGANADGNHYSGSMDDIRITKGVGRYVTNFTAPVLQNGDVLQVGDVIPVTDDIYYTGGKVGFGTTNPDYTVDVTGSVNTTGGFFENGQLGEYNSNSGAGKAYVNGGEGGTSTGSTSGDNSAGHGGFGGGSASGYWSRMALAGAGGGYSGGGGGLYMGYTGSPVGGGGGSKNNGSNQVNTYSNNDNDINSGNGYVIITKQ